MDTKTPFFVRHLTEEHAKLSGQPGHTFDSDGNAVIWHEGEIVGKIKIIWSGAKPQFKHPNSKRHYDRYTECYTDYMKYLKLPVYYM
jgi:hypothetical protein